MTDGSLKLNDTARISRSWTAMISTFPWHQSVIAFCQCTTLRGSYVAFRRSVCSMVATQLLPGTAELSRRSARKADVKHRVRASLNEIGTRR